MSSRAIDTSLSTLRPHEIKAALAEKKSSPAKDSSWSNLIPLIATVAAGCLLFPTFAIGAKVGAIGFCATATSHIVLHSIGVLKEDGSSKYIQDCFAHPLTTVSSSLFLPIALADLVAITTTSLSTP